MYRSQYHIYRDKPQLFGYKKKWIRGTKMLEGNRHSLPLDFFSPNITSFSYFLERQNPDFFFPFSNSQFLSNWTVKLMFTNVAISPYSGIFWVLF